MDIYQKHKIVSQAFRMACKYIHDNPPNELPYDDMDLLMCMVDSASDSEGKRYMSYFLHKAQDDFNAEV